jgi:type I restriction enzyme, S subunit
MSISLPKSWRLLKISEVAQVNPRRPSELLKLADDFMITFVPMPSVSEHEGAITNPIEKPYTEVKKGFTYFEENDVLFAKITPCMQNGKAAIARGLTNRLGFGSTEFHVLRAGDDVIPEWLYYFVRQKSFRDEAQANFRGSAGQQRVPSDFLAEHLIPIPSVKEQSQIVHRIKECFSRIDEIKSLRKESQDEAKALLESVRFSTFGAIDQIPNGWSEKRLDELADVIYGISAAISGNRDASIGTPIIRMANMSLDGKLDLSDLRYLPITDAQRKKFLLKRGDLLLNWRSGSPAHIGKTALFDEEGEFTCASFILRIRAYPDKCNNRYLRHVLNYMRERGYFVRRQRMQVNAKLNATEFSGFPIRIPPTIDEQELIADRLDAAELTCDRIRSEYQSAATDGDLLQGAVLSKAFVGEL